MALSPSPQHLQFFVEQSHVFVKEKLVYVTPLDAEDAEEHQEVGGGAFLNYASQKGLLTDKPCGHGIRCLPHLIFQNIKKRRRAHELTKIYNERAERGSVTE
ncbi:unnamed protein product [Polarella glacialis]|uniref:Uncharacterized protein n=1 Tax=Polarella glacialis TaxID=89957 RepID=A0A813ESN4_POLGL|nr:unnamed protein product [Polarella glacialis]